MSSADPATRGHQAVEPPETQGQTVGTSATIHYIYDPFNPPLNAIISVARRLQECLIEYGALPEGAALPFPALAPADQD
ncbi:MAG: hypothetical protein ACKOPG_10405 [Novosphingobium sp.]